MLYSGAESEKVEFVHRSTRGFQSVFPGILLLVLAGCSEQSGESDSSCGGEILKVDAEEGKTSLEILNPLDGALFPPDIAAPTFRWKDANPASETWLISFRFSDGGGESEFRSNDREWTVPDEQWEIIKGRSVEKVVEVTIRGSNKLDPGSPISQDRISISTSREAVDAPIFYREVNLPFLTAVKDPAAHIRWRFGPISAKELPPIVLEKMPVCGNCHSFAADGSTLAMEVDSGNDKGSYAIAPIEKQIVLDDGKLITWSDYKKNDGELTLGLLCQISPDGRYVVGCVKDRALAIYRPNLMFSQLFFPVKGILAIYDREANTIRPLPGGDDRTYVQTNATWSPDGETLVFARAEAYDPPGVKHIKSVLLPQEAGDDFVNGKRPFKYDLYRIPFNDGKGGKAEPVEGASNNGMSNYFPKFSPDGKWIVFCKAENFMLLQPDSELYIMPASGGRPRRLKCNTSRMNSWHSWSPNGKWLVFSSKEYTAYTQLFLTHIDERGQSSVPVVLSRFSAADRAANIPEFVNLAPDAIKKISIDFLDDNNYYRAACEFVKADDPEGALPLLRESLELNPDHAGSNLELAAILAAQGKTDEARSHLDRIFKLDKRSVPPDFLSGAHCRLASILYGEKKLPEAAEHFRQALRVDPDHFESRSSLGVMLMEAGKLDESLVHLAEAARLGPKDPSVNFNYGSVLHRLGRLEEAVDYYQRAVEYEPKMVPAMLALVSICLMADRPELFDVDNALTYAKQACEVTDYKHPQALEILASVYAMSGKFSDAVQTANQAVETAQAVGDRETANRVREMLQVLKKIQADRHE